jgi:hypothetical protein
LAPGAEIPCFWGSTFELADFLKQRNLEGGITVTSSYESLTGESIETEWVLNPLLVASRVSLAKGKGVEEIAKATENIAKVLSKPVSSIHNELRVTTYEERQRRELLLEQMHTFLKDRLQNSGSGNPPQVLIDRPEIEAVGQNPYTAAKLFEIYLNIPGYWFGDYENLDEAGHWRSVRLTNIG